MARPRRRDRGERRRFMGRRGPNPRTARRQRPPDRRGPLPRLADRLAAVGAAAGDRVDHPLPSSPMADRRPEPWASGRGPAMLGSADLPTRRPSRLPPFRLCAPLGGRAGIAPAAFPSQGAHPRAHPGGPAASPPGRDRGPPGCRGARPRGPSMNEETFALRDVLRVLRRHRRELLAAVVLAVLAALIVSFAQPKRYTAKAQLVI